MKQLRHRLLLAGVLSCLLLGACQKTADVTDEQTNSAESAQSTSELTALSIGTADTGGTMAPVGRAIGSLLSKYDADLKITSTASSGSITNVRNLMSGNIDLGLVSGDIAYAAVNGKDAFAEAPADKLRVIAAVYPSVSNWIAPVSSGLCYVHDLKGLSFGIGPQDSTTDLAAELSLNIMGITRENSTFINTSLGSGARDVRDGKIAATHGFAGVPVDSFASLAKEIPCRVLRFTDQELNEIVRSNPFYFKGIIPAGSYEGQYEDTATFGIKCLLCVSADMNEELAYRITKLLYEHAAELKDYHSALGSIEKRSFMYNTLPIELHPGAARYYNELGVLGEDS